MRRLKLEYVKDIQAIHLAGRFFSLWICMAWRPKGYTVGYTPQLHRFMINIPFTKWGIHVSLFKYRPLKRLIRVKGA